jgi:serine/threonine protein kinase
MKYEFGQPAWMDESPEGDEEKKERLHKETESAIRASIEKLLASQENFLGKGKTAEVHFLDKDRELCYKIIRRIEVMARADAVKNIPEKYREIFEQQKAKVTSGKKSSAQIEDESYAWHVDLFTEATYLSRARKIAEGSPVKIPRPDAKLEIRGREEGEGYEIIDDMQVLLMETMKASSVEDIISRGLPLPSGFNFDAFCQKVEAYLSEMHADKLYHRDLHAGNIMIDNETGDPVIIDFGRSAVSNEEEAYVEEILPGTKTHFIKDEQMFRDKVKIPLAEYLKRSKLT